MAEEKEPTGSSGSKEGERTARKPRRPLRLPTARQVGFFLFSLLLVAGVVFYVWWCVAFRVCIDNGVYAIVVTLVGFGLAGMWITLPPRHHAP